MKYTSLLIETKQCPIISFCGIPIHYSAGILVNTNQYEHQNKVQHSETAEICLFVSVNVHLNFNNNSDYPEINFKGLKSDNELNSIVLPDNIINSNWKLMFSTDLTILFGDFMYLHLPVTLISYADPWN